MFQKENQPKLVEQRRGVVEACGPDLLEVGTSLVALRLDLLDGLFRLDNLFVEHVEPGDCVAFCGIELPEFSGATEEIVVKDVVTLHLVRYQNRASIFRNITRIDSEQPSEYVF